jgi:hypothetical protein
MRTTRLSATVAVLFGAAFFAACSDEHAPTQLTNDTQLEAARAATTKYQDLSRALADGYVDAKIVMQQMGHHYLNASLLDDKFEADKPEILVYAPDAAGRMKLVAVEYAVPLDKAATAPEGFVGSDDVWSTNTKYGLWTLHAWLYQDNPAGVFNATNQRIQLDPGTLEGMRLDPMTH